MKKEKLPDGFPVENGNVEGAKEYVCDNCGKVYTPETDGRVYAFAEPDHNYFFCSEECAEQFAKDNGLETFSDQSGFNDYVFELEKGSEQAGEPEPTLIEPEEPPTCYEKKAAECWQHVVKSAQEISQAASKIVVLQDQLKEAKKEYDALVSRQNSYILTNGDSIQTTFADMDGEQKPEPDAEGVVDTLAWKDEPVTVLTNYGLTEKQAEKAQEAFGTLGRLQDWLCSDYREKVQGVGQALQDKLTDALNQYTEVIYANAKAETEQSEVDAEQEAESEQEPENKEE